MATTTQTRYTPEDLLAITDRPMPELVAGQLVERKLGQRADAVSSRVTWIISNYVHTTKLGLVNGSQCGYQIFADDPNKVRIPDASFTRKERLTEASGVEGHARVAPDLAVEVISPNDYAADLFVKVREYLGAGVPLAWVINPEDRSVQVFRADGTANLVGADATLDGGDVLPGFQCRVAELFET